MSLLLSQSNKASDLAAIPSINLWIDVLCLAVIAVGAVIAFIAAWNRRPKTPQHYLESIVFPDRYRSLLVLGMALLFIGLAVLAVRLIVGSSSL